MADPTDVGDLDILRNKRNATRYQILVKIAERQPAVSQREIAEAIGITAQAVSDYLGDLVSEGRVHKRGRGRYEVTEEGIDWLLAQTNDLQSFVEHVSEEIVDEVEIETAIATAVIKEGQRVSLTMRDGALHAIPGETGDATAVAVADAEVEQDVGVTGFDREIEDDPGTVTILSVPPIQDGGSAGLSTNAITDRVSDHDLVATAGTEALVAVRKAGIEPDIRFGTAEAVSEATIKGLSVLLLATADEIARHIDTLREEKIGYEIIETAEQ